MDEKTQIITEDDPYPVALPPAKSPPAFPIGALPPTIRDMVNFVSETTQVYPDMPASVALAALSVCLQGKAKVSFSPYWSEELNLYMLIIAPPGERKSAVFSAMTAPINKFVNEYNALHLIDVQTYFNSKKMLDSKLNKAIEKGEDNSVIRDIQMEINALQPVKEMKLITTDVTAEALAAIMSDNNDTMGIMSPEGGIFDVISGMYSNSVINLNIFLSSYDGEPVKIDRKYGSVSLTHPLLTFGICAQPQVLNNVISNQQFIGKGLTQRFLFCLPDSMIGHRKLIQDINGTEVTKRYKELIYRLLNMPPNPEQCIELSCKATDLFTAYAEKIEYQMSENETLADYREFFSKLPGKTLRMAGLLHLCEHSPSECISGETMAAAIEISKYYGQHYLKMMCAESYNDTPQLVLDKMITQAKKSGISTISFRDIKRSVRKLTDEQVKDALEVLTAHKYISYVPPEHNSGNRRKESYTLNPILLENGHCPGQTDDCPTIVPTE